MRDLIADLGMIKELYRVKKLDVVHTRTECALVFRTPDIVSKEE